MLTHLIDSFNYSFVVLKVFGTYKVIFLLRRK